MQVKKYDQLKWKWIVLTLCPCFSKHHLFLTWFECYTYINGVTDSWGGWSDEIWKKTFAGSLWQMVVIVLLKYVVKLHVPGERHSTPAHLQVCFQTESTGKQCGGDTSGSNYNTAYVCRSEYRKDRLTSDLPSQEKSLSDFIVSSTIYISNHLSCKLHASTLTRTKDGTINYK